MSLFKVQNKHAILVISLLLGIAVVIYAFWLFVCRDNESCSYELMLGLLKPSLWFSLAAVPSVSIFLFQSHSLFKKWFRYIISWYIPVMIIALAQIDIYSSFILSMNRDEAALWWAAGLFIVSCVFVIVMKLKTRGSVTIGK